MRPWVRVATAAILLLGCGATPEHAGPRPLLPQSSSFRHEVLSHTQRERLTGIATGEFGKPSLTYPPLGVDPKYRHVLTFMVSPFLPPLREPIASSGPLVLYSDEMDVLVFSPMDHFFVSLVSFDNGTIVYGLEGKVNEVPAGFTHRFLLVEGRGMAATVDHWGDLLLADRRRARTDRYADCGLSYLGYWTDNGAAYYYTTEPGMTPEQTLLAVKADGSSRGIPYRYMQIDSWWYYKEPGPIPFIKILTGGLLSWKPMPEVFPDGLAAFRERIDLPLIAHNKWFAERTPYRERYEFVDGEGLSLPTGRGVYDEFVADARSWGVVTYEQDWLVTQYLGTPWLHETVGRAETWMGNIHSAVQDGGLTMQLCMAGGAHLMDAIDRPAVTTVRTSVDYQPGVSKESFWPMFHTVNMLARALGVLPFKDNFRSSEPCGEQEALISALSAGMVGPSDKIGTADPEILGRTCRPDGLLLKPDRPAVPIDGMFLPHSRPFIVHTVSERGDEGGVWVYLAAFHLARRHPERRPLDELFGGLTYDFRDLGTMFVWPDRVDDWRVDLSRDLGIEGPRVLYDWRAKRAELVEGAFEIPAVEHLYDYAYLVLAPIAWNGLALIGETGKYVTLADRRFRRIEHFRDAVCATLDGVPGEEVLVRVFDAKSGMLLPAAAATIDREGSARVCVWREAPAAAWIGTSDRVLPEARKGPGRSRPSGPAARATLTATEGPQRDCRLRNPGRPSGRSCGS